MDYSATIDSTQNRYWEIRQREEEIRRAEEQKREDARRAEEARQAQEEESIFGFINSGDESAFEYNSSDFDENIFSGFNTASSVPTSQEVLSSGTNGVAGSGSFADITNFDGVIDASAQANNIGDCYGLTGFNSLSYSSEGAKAIKDNLVYNDDGSVDVKFPGVGMTYHFSAEQVQGMLNDDSGNGQARGDLEMKLLEGALRSYREDVESGNILVDVNSPFYVADTNTGERGNSVLDGGFVEQIYYLMTGKLSEQTTEPSEVYDYLNKFEQNPDSTAMSCSFKGGYGDSNSFTVRDANGENVQLYYSHAYAVKSVDGDKVTIVNPWDSSKEIVLDKDTFAQYANVTYCDLSDNNKDQSGMFTKLTNAIKDGIRNVTDTVKDFFNNVFGSVFGGVGNAQSVEDPFAQGFGGETNDIGTAEAGFGSKVSNISFLIMQLIEKFNNGEITKEELTKAIEKLNVNMANMTSNIVENANIAFQVEYALQ